MKARGYSFSLVYQFVSTSIMHKYSRSMLGVLWHLLSPFFNYLVLLIVFTNIYDGNSPGYAGELLLGIIVFTFFRDSFLESTMSVYQYRNIVTKVNFPKIVLPISAVISSLITFLLSILVTFLVLFVVSRWVPSFDFLISLFVSVVFLAILGFVISLVTSVLIIKYTDLLNVIHIVLQAMFWLSGVFFRMNDVDGFVGSLLKLNPVAIAIDLVKSSFSGADFMYVNLLAVESLILLLVSVLAYCFFILYSPRVTDELT